MDERATLDAAYRRLRQKLEAKDVSIEALRAAALDTLDHVYGSDVIAAELARLRQAELDAGVKPKDDPPKA